MCRLTNRHDLASGTSTTLPTEQVLSARQAIWIGDPDECRRADRLPGGDDEPVWAHEAPELTEPVEAANVEAAELLGAAALTALGAEAVLRVWPLALDVEPEEPDDPFALEEDALCAVALVLVPVLSVNDAEPRCSALALAARAMTAPAPISEPATTPRLTRRSRAKAASRVAGVRSMVLIVHRLRKRIARIAAILPKDETG